MLRKNKIDNTFGPVGSFAGTIIFSMAILALVFFYDGRIINQLVSITGILLGAFIAFSYSCALIDTNNGRIKYSNMIFGVIRTGKWLKIKPDMKIGIFSSTRIYRSYSRSNRILDISSKGFSIFLFDSNNTPLFPLGLKKTKELVLIEAKLLSENLNIPYEFME